MATAKEATQAPTTATDDANVVVDERRASLRAASSRFRAGIRSTRSTGSCVDALIPGRDGPAFEQREVEFPKFWSQTATNIVAQKYFRGRLSSPERERSVKQMIGRVVETITAWDARAATSPTRTRPRPSRPS